MLLVLQCVKRAAVRDKFEQEGSSRTGYVEVGERITALEMRMTNANVRRFRFSGGWVSSRSQKGDVLLLEAGTSSSPRAAPSQDATATRMGSACLSGAHVDGAPLQPLEARIMPGLEVVATSRVKIRAGLSFDSAPVGDLQSGEVVQLLQVEQVEE
eukprot:COSAG05_NODE_5170_length_1245_cov_61.240838_1_plen_156_part_00